MPQYVVIAMERSGGSLAAQLLNQAGVPMSLNGKWAPARPGYTHQTWEDQELFVLNRTAMNEVARAAASQAYVQKRMEAHGDTWGVKDPALCSLAGWLLEYMPAPRLVVVWRAPAAVLASQMTVSMTDRATVERWYFAQRAKIDNLLKAHSDLPVLSLDYDQMLADPEPVLHSLRVLVGDQPAAQQPVAPAGTRRFLADGRWSPDTVTINKTGDWGKVAVGSRIANEPEAGFVKSYQHLILNGLRPGDAVLEPVAGLPGHWAADRMVVDYLRSGCDTLLMLDDDMTFPPAALEALRTVPEGMAFDMLMGFCAKRAWPPRPITMRRLKYQPPDPMRQAGDYYVHHLDYGDEPVTEVDMVGLAFTLVRRHVFEAMIGQWGPTWTHFFPYVASQSDDAAFCQRAQRLGFRMAVALNVHIGHIGKQTFGHAQFQEWLGQVNIAAMGSQL